MSRLDQEQAVIRMASELELDWRNPVSEIINYCLAKIERWITESDGVDSLARLEQVVCENVKLLFEEVWSDDDLDHVVRKYTDMGDFVFATLRHDLDESTFAALIKRAKVEKDDPHRYVAVIDCRADKAHRRFFTRWHEIAHMLTLTRQLDLPFHRSTTKRSPEERLMDTIAGKIGFYDPIFKPAVEAEIDASGYLSLEGVERIRQAMCPNASFQATLIASVERASVPLIYMTAGMGLKKAERAELDSNQLDLFPMDKPEPMLRALSVKRNDAAKTCDLRVDPNMQVPEESLVADYFRATEGSDTAVDRSGAENLALWRHSDGTPVGEIDIHIEARRSGDEVIALVRPASRVCDN